MNKFWILIAVLMLSSCVFGVSQPSRFYTLQPEELGLYVNNEVKANIGVREVAIPDYLDKPQIVTLKDNLVELNISETNRWSEPLSTMIQRVVADDIGDDLPNAMVKPRVSGRESFKYIVQIEINKMEGSWKKEAVLEAWWSISNKNGKILAQKKTSLSRPLGSSYDDLVKVESILLGELSNEISTQIAKLEK